MTDGGAEPKRDAIGFNNHLEVVPNLDRHQGIFFAARERPANEAFDLIEDAAET